MHPSITSRSGITVAIASQSEWDIFSEVWAAGEYDDAILRAFDNSSADGPLRVIDLGANVGFFSLRCIELATLRNLSRPLALVAVEGAPRAFRVLQRNMHGQPGNYSLSLFNGLVGERKGTGLMYDSAYAGANTVVPANGKTSRLPFRGAHAVPVEYLDLEQALNYRGPIDLLKCDIEGSEAVFLTHYPELLARTRTLVIELHPLRCDVSECGRELARQGFTRIAVVRQGPTMSLEIHERAEARLG